MISSEMSDLTEIIEIIEDWDGPLFDCYDIPFISSRLRDEDGLYERKYLFNDISLRIGNKRDLNDPYWFGDREDEIKKLAENDEIPPAEDILFFTVVYFLNRFDIKGKERTAILEQFE